MRVDPRKDFTATITGLEQARQLTPDETGHWRAPSGAIYVTLQKYEEDMDGILRAFKLLKQFQDRTAWTLKLTAIAFGGSCTLAAAISAVYAAFKHG